MSKYLISKNILQTRNLDPQPIYVDVFFQTFSQENEIFARTSCIFSL